MKRPSLQHLFERTAEAFGVTPHQMRGAGTEDARRAFCRLAANVGYDHLSIGMQIAATTSAVDIAILEGGARFDSDVAFGAKCLAISIECQAEAGVAARIPYPLPTTTEPRATAARLAAGRREAMTVGIIDLVALGAAFLALDAELAELRTAFNPLLNGAVSHGEIAQV